MGQEMSETMPRQAGIPGIEAEIDAPASDSCFTPKEIISGVIACFGGIIGTDPCWHPRSHVPLGGCRYDGGKLGNGLRRVWRGSLWMNPPYSDPRPWCERFKDHADTGQPSIALVKLDPTTRAWGYLTRSQGAAVGLIGHRVRFEGAYAKGGAPNMCVAFVARGVPLRRLRQCLPMAEWLHR
jgi:hypothetical protein